MKLALKYTLFAIIATCVNIAAQDVSIRLYDQAYAVAFSVLVGTVAGLLVKYILDKKYIFNFRAQNIAHDTRTFMIYTLMGLATTVVFWGFEFGFDAMFQTKEMRYLGGIIGLAIGYLIKYRLDKHYVFGKAGG
ncbi:MAG: GtrA family protein [Pseudomonadota bacterium]